MNKYTSSEMIKCVTREIAMRKRVYRNRVQEGKMMQTDANHEIGCMEQVLKTLVELDQPELIP